ncbi:50S ribosomal protein L30 [Abyssisolibacter fermentans]|uniref:50S ribosomal protein L30 n=1 Tax=Abyssisolibacter fermentans TaxID=1766203 RepID=UPI0008300872|nr:50S ribosomal protein L30 [Abyssisolibacter fermentans]
MATIKVKLTRSKIGRIEKQKRTIEALGLKKIGQIVEHEDNAQIRGMIKKVNHMVEIVE